MRKKLILKSLLTLALIVALITTIIGCAGEPGLKGNQGPMGLQGEQGEPGPMGPIGLQGEPGPKGSTGAKGATGSTGATGAQGEQGEQGPRGPGGAGATGAKGATGATGPQGPAGEDGEDYDPQALLDLQEQIAALEARLDILEFVPPIIDGVLDVDEWGVPDFTGTQTVDVSSFEVNIYVENDDENLYIAAEYVSGDFSVAQSLGLATALNIYIDANPPTPTDGVVDNGDLAVIASDGVIHIPYDPGANDWDWQETGSASAAGIKIAADGDYMTGNGIVEVKIPFSLLDGVGPGSTIGLCFQAFGYTNPEGAQPNWPETYADFTFGR